VKEIARRLSLPLRTVYGRVDRCGLDPEEGAPGPGGDPDPPALTADLEAALPRWPRRRTSWRGSTPWRGAARVPGSRTCRRPRTRRRSRSRRSRRSRRRRTAPSREGGAQARPRHGLEGPAARTAPGLGAPAAAAIFLRRHVRGRRRSVVPPRARHGSGEIVVDGDGQRGAGAPAMAPALRGRPRPAGDGRAAMRGPTAPTAGRPPRLGSGAKAAAAAPADAPAARPGLLRDEPPHRRRRRGRAARALGAVSFSGAGGVDLARRTPGRPRRP